MHWRELLGVLATAIAFFSYIPYLRDIHAGKTQPHAFSWFMWMLLTFTAFWGQITNGAGPGAWVTGFTAAIALIILSAALLKNKGSVKIVRLDWVCLVGAMLAFILLFWTRQPVFSAILVVFTDALAFFPTFRKSYNQPYGETMSTYVLSGTKYVIALLAMEKISVVTVLMPIYLILMNILFVSMLIIRRTQLQRINTDEKSSP